MAMHNDFISNTSPATRSCSSNATVANNVSSNISGQANGDNPASIILKTGSMLALGGIVAQPEGPGEVVAIPTEGVVLISAGLVWSAYKIAHIITSMINPKDLRYETGTPFKEVSRQGNNQSDLFNPNNRPPKWFWWMAGAAGGYEIYDNLKSEPLEINKTSTPIPQYLKKP
jgi:hypothetical protein